MSGDGRAALPRPSVCLNVPKTGSQFMNRFFDAADWLHLKRACGLRRLEPAWRRSASGWSGGIKRHGIEFGNLNCQSCGTITPVTVQLARRPPALSEAVRAARYSRLVLFLLPLPHAAR